MAGSEIVVRLLPELLGACSNYQFLALLLLSRDWRISNIDPLHEFSVLSDCCCQ